MTINMWIVRSTTTIATGTGYLLFHLTTNEKIKRTVCESFQDTNGVIWVVLCSTSFSMGLDFMCVHTVVQCGPANDLDDYLQSSGRAGRDC